MIFIHLECRLELCSYITNTGEQLGQLFILQQLLNSQLAVPVWWLAWRESWHFPLWEQSRIKVVCTMNICHFQMNHDKINSKGKCTYKPRWDTLYRHSTIYLLSLQQNAILIRSQRSQQVCIESSAKYTLTHGINVTCTFHHQYIYIHVRRVDEKCKFGLDWQNGWKLRSRGSKMANNWKILLWLMSSGGVNWADVLGLKVGAANLPVFLTVSFRVGRSEQACRIEINSEGSR